MCDSFLLPPAFWARGPSDHSSCDDETLGSADSYLVARLDAAEALNGSGIAARGPKGPWRLSPQSDSGSWPPRFCVCRPSRQRRAPSTASMPIVIISLVHDHDRLRGLRGGHRREPPARGAHFRLVRQTSRSGARAGGWGSCIGHLRVLEVIVGPARRTCAHGSGHRSDGGHRDRLSDRPRHGAKVCWFAPASTVAVIANLGGLALGPLIAGLLAHFASQALTLPYIVFFCAIVISTVGVYFTPEGHPARHPLPAMHLSA